MAASQRVAPLSAAAFAAACAVCLAAGPAAGDEAPMGADAFEAYVTGRTLTYSTGGIAYGAEQYLPGRQVIWSFLDGNCQRGLWYPENGEICFVYENGIAPQCWSFRQKGAGLAARYADDPEGLELYEVQQSPEPLLCLGPDVGV